MAKTMKRILAMLIAVSLCVGQLTVAAWAVEEEQSVLTASIEVSVNEEKDTTVTVGDYGQVTTVDTTGKSWSGADTVDGAEVEVEGSENSTHTTVTDDLGNPITESGKTEGSETITSTKVDTDEDSKTETLPVETTDNQYVEGTTTEGQWSDPVDIAAPTTESKDAEISYQPGEVTLNMSQENPTDEVSEEGDLTTAVKENGLYTDMAEVSVTGAPTDPEGEIKTVKEPIKDAEGNVIGYMITKTITKTVEEEGDPNTTEGESVTGTPVTGETVTTPGSSETTFTLERPDESETVNEDGSKSVTTVEEILENGKVVGYKSTTVITDAKGKEISRSSESIYGTTKTTEVSNETTTTTTVTTTPLNTNKVVTTTTTVITNAEGVEMVPVLVNGTFWGWAYKAELGEVTSSGSHGSVDMDSLTPTQSQPATGKVDTTTDLYNRKDSDTKISFDGWDFQWLGEYGLESAIRVEAGNVTTWQPHQFVLENEAGEKFYVYCADFEVDPELTFRYSMENLEDADYYNDAAAARIRAIAMNGYWGTSEGVGSLDAVKKLMEDSGLFTQKEIDSLTPGEALTATQAAIWKYGNSGSTKFGSDIVGAYYNGSSFNYNYSNATVQKLYDYLITLSEDATDSTTLITENHFATEASITVGDKAEDVLANLDDNDDNDVYNTSVSFSLLVEPDKKSDDLVVTVLDGSNNVIRKVRLAGDSSNDDASVFGTVTKDGDMYTINDLQIAEGVNITLNLAGTQHLDKGVYLYTSEIREDESSQTFVGLAEGDRDVDLSVNLKFEVTDPQANIETTYTSQSTSKVDTRIDSKTDTRTETVVTTDIKVITTVTEETKRAWDSEWTKEYEYEYDVEPHNDDGDLTEIEDEDVALADAPKTGDISMLWAVLALASVSGMFLLKKREEG